jgi:hypothetical protein
MRLRILKEPLKLYCRSLCFLVLGMILFACSSGQPLPSPTATIGSQTTTYPTVTLSPTSTATPVVPSAILLAPVGSDPALSENLQSVLGDLSEQAGLQFEVAENLSPQDLEAGVKLVIALATDPGIASLAASAPETQFLAIGIPEVQPDGNLSVINTSTDRPDQLAFAAGYLAATITEDWRVGVISGGDTPSGKAAEVGFTNGVYFLCGLCRPVVPPFPIPGYPLVAQLPPAASQEEQRSALEYFQTWQVGTVYVAPEVADPDLLNELADAGLNISGTGSPPVELRSSWVASIGSADITAAVQEIWPALLDGQGGQSASLSLALEEVNPQLLSPGRQGLVEEMLADLQAGYIDTGVDPETGESRFTD